METRGNLKFTVHRDIGDASKKLEVKIDASQALGLSPHQLAMKNLLKGVTADESTTVHVKVLILAPTFLFILRLFGSSLLCNQQQFSHHEFQMSMSCIF